MNRLLAVLLLSSLTVARASADMKRVDSSAVREDDLSEEDYKTQLLNWQTRLATAPSAKESADSKSEREALGLAVDRILNGNQWEGEKRLHEFKAAHPKSPRVNDASEIIGLLMRVRPAQQARYTQEHMDNSGGCHQDLLKGAVRFSGPYPTTGRVAYKTTSGESLKVRAYPGQVLVHFSAGSDPCNADSLTPKREAAIKVNHGVILEKIPMMGQYLIGVPVGQEGPFIDAIRASGAGVDEAEPNTAAEALSNGRRDN